MNLNAYKLYSIQYSDKLLQLRCNAWKNIEYSIWTNFFLFEFLFIRWSILEVYSFRKLNDISIIERFGIFYTFLNIER